MHLARVLAVGPRPTAHAGVPRGCRLLSIYLSIPMSGQRSAAHPHAVTDPPSVRPTRLRAPALLRTLRPALGPTARPLWCHWRRPPKARHTRACHTRSPNVLSRRASMRCGRRPMRRSSLATALLLLVQADASCMSSMSCSGSSGYGWKCNNRVNDGTTTTAAARTLHTTRASIAPLRATASPPPARRRPRRRARATPSASPSLVVLTSPNRAVLDSTRR